MPKAVDFSTGQTWWRCLANPMSRLISWVPIILTKELSSTSFSTISFIFSTSSIDLFSTNWPYLKSCYSNWDMKMIVIFFAIKKIQTLCQPHNYWGTFFIILWSEVAWLEPYQKFRVVLLLLSFMTYQNVSETKKITT